MIDTFTSRESDELSSDIESDEEFDTVYSCSFCKASNMTKSKFIAHSRIHTKIENRSEAVENLVVEKEMEELAARRAAAAKGFKVQLAAGCSVTLYICTTCGQGNLLLKDLESHSSVHPQHTESHYCHICQQQFEDNNKLDSHLGIHLYNNDLFCQFCNKSFTTIKDLELHEITHLQEEFVCNECCHRFKTKDLVMFHFKKSHLVDSRCEICKFEFKTSNLINEHFMTHTSLNVINKTVNYYKCDFCKKEYGSKISLQRHILFVHKNKMPYICKQCGLTVYHEEMLRKHVAAEHQNVEKLKNVCRPDLKSETNEVGKSNLNAKDPLSHCNKTVDIDNLNNLNEEHCKFCKEAFKNHETLSIHINKVHSKKSINPVMSILPFQCQICNAQFKLEFELDDHSKLHNATYQCHICYKEFTTDTSLLEHATESHNEQMESVDVLEVMSSSDECTIVESEILGL